MAVTTADYARAQRFLPWNVEQLCFNLSLQPHWLGGDRFWYRAARPDGVEFLLVDPERGAREPAFDHVRLAAALSTASGTPYTHPALPFQRFDFVDEERAIRFEVEDTTWLCSLDTYRCERSDPPAAAGKDELASPDGRWAASVRDHDLYLRSLETGEERRLTHDGEPHYDYATAPESRESTVTDQILGKPLPPSAVWSPDSKQLFTYRLDQRHVGEMHLIQSALPEGEYRPMLHSWRIALAGDEHVPLAELVVIDVENGSVVHLDAPPLFVLYLSPFQLKTAWWHGDSRQVSFVYEERGRHVVRLMTADAQTGASREVLVERSEANVSLAPVPYESPNIRTLESGEVIWYSERDCWGHLYLYEGSGGALKGQITAGPWNVSQIVHVDEEERWLYFTAMGREEGRDPYLRHLYRVRLDGTDLELLTPEDADHAITVSPSGRYVVDTLSRVDLAPVSVLRSADGRIVCPLEEADISALHRLGWQFPEPFCVKARDGVTDIYGVIVRPTNFDATRRYPVIDSDYPGPQVIRTPHAFASSADREWLWQDQALAELGFIVVRIDGQGTPFRSRAFLNVAYGRDFGEAGGLADHVAGLGQLAARYPEMDIERVGIYGHSGGGYASARAMLEFPDFYKVAVSSAGNHDQRSYTADWGERYVGMPDGEKYERGANARLAGNLEGKLLLVYGDMDDNVHAAMTLQLVDALIAANKDFDMLVLPNHNHSFFDLRKGLDAYEKERSERRISPYFVRRRWDYFVRHLRGEEPPAGYTLAERRRA